MKKSIKKYFTFIHKNISDKGIFIFSNRHGVSNKSYNNIYNYPFDNYWNIKKFGLHRPYLTCSDASHYFIIFERIKNNLSSTKGELYKKIYNSQNNIFNNYRKYFLSKIDKNRKIILPNKIYFEEIENFFECIKNEYLISLTTNKSTNKSINNYSKKIYSTFEINNRFNPYYFIKLYLIFSIQNNYIYKKKIYNLFLKKANYRWKIRFLKILDLLKEENNLNNFLKKLKLNRLDTYNFLNHMHYKDKKQFDLYLNSIINMSKKHINNPNILFSILKLSFKNLNINISNKMLNLLNYNLDYIQGEPVIELINKIYYATKSFKIREKYCQKFIYNILDKMSLSPLKKEFLYQFTNFKLFNKKIRISKLKNINTLKDYYELTWFGKHLLNLNSPLGNKILIKSVKYRKNSTHYAYIGKILIDKSKFKDAAKLFDECLKERAHDKELILLSHIAKNKLSTKKKKN